MEKRHFSTGKRLVSDANPAESKRIPNKNLSKIKIVRQYNPSPTDTTMKERGISLLEAKELITTPVSIEFNLGQTLQEFNVISAVQTTFQKLRSVDSNIKVYGAENKAVVWEPDTALPEDKQFDTVFKVREQTFRKGNTKITIHCIVESQFTINKLKYMEPVQRYITNNNIWIKPDFYSTKVVTSPGFFTLIHPRLTNKTVLMQELAAVIAEMEIDEEDQIVQD